MFSYLLLRIFESCYLFVLLLHCSDFIDLLNKQFSKRNKMILLVLVKFFKNCTALYHIYKQKEYKSIYL